MRRGDPVAGPMTTASGIWVPSTSAFTRVHSPLKTGVNTLDDALCAGTTRRSITRIADRAGHLPPAAHFAFEIVRGLDLVLDHHVEADGLKLLLRRRLLHDRIDLRVELRHHRIGRLRRREK